jgi:hypothetical protein
VVVLDRAAQVAVGVLGRSDREMVVQDRGDPGVAVLRRLVLEVVVRGQGGLEPVARTRESLAPADRETRARMVESRARIALTMEIPVRRRPDSRRLPESKR